MNKENLLKLATYLEGPLKAAFDMAWFDDGKGNPMALSTSRTECGTVGCAVGHAPYAGIKKNLEETWVHFSLRAFGITESEHKFLFAGAWGMGDLNNPIATARRLKWFVSFGVPEGWVNDYLWTPPVEHPVITSPVDLTKVETIEVTRYRTVVIDSQVKELQKQLTEN